MPQDSALDPNIAWFAVLLMALLMVLQSIVIFVLFSRTAKRLRAGQPAVSSFLARVESGTTALRQLLSHIDGVPTKLAEVRGQTPGLLASFSEVVKSLDQDVADFAEQSRSYLHRFDRIADTVLSSFSNQTFRVHRAVVDPAVRLSTLLQPINDVASRIFGGNDSPASHSPDQEIFI